MYTKSDPPNVAYMQHEILLKLYTILPNVAHEQHVFKINYLMSEKLFCKKFFWNRIKNTSLIRKKIF